MAGSVVDSRLVDSVADWLRVTEVLRERDPADSHIDTRPGIGISQPFHPFGEFVCLENL